MEDPGLDKQTTSLSLQAIAADPARLCAGVAEARS
jgi:hypothetical protein